jgi:hypothetical protein
MDEQRDVYWSMIVNGEHYDATGPIPTVCCGEWDHIRGWVDYTKDDLSEDVRFPIAVEFGDGDLGCKGGGVVLSMEIQAAERFIVQLQAAIDHARKLWPDR